ncbi:MAG: aldehyde dehydrogenase [Rhodoglobus sp.]|nr:aldehyde dehydrogenase [Rhodoglobus sp.]
MTTDPHTGAQSDTGIEPSDEATVDAIAGAASAASVTLAGRDREWRASFLSSLASSLENHGDRLVAIAQSETGLTPARLMGELKRSCFQLNLFAEAVRDGGFLEATIDHATETSLGLQPDVRRLLMPLGPVAVFGSSNFPFAFSVPGGDTASALAAGNPVVVKAHSAHLLTSRAAFEALQEGARQCQAPDGTLGIVFGQPAGTALVSHPAIAAVGFTGSLGAAQHLRAAIDRRARPIPFYGELQSVNPLIISAAALAERSNQIAAGLAASITASGGQLCTKPGIAFLPSGAAADLFADLLAASVSEADPGVLLNERVLAGFQVAESELEAASGVRSIAGRPGSKDGGGFRVNARVLRVRAADLTADHTIEAFGPLVLLVDYDGDEQLVAALSHVPDSLTTTLHIETQDEAWAAALLPKISESCGRVIFNGFPTGVRVSWAQHHGGPWPSTNTLHTSVGVTAMRRFLRPFAWQNTPEPLLPAELRDDYRGIPRRIDGELVLATL